MNTFNIPPRNERRAAFAGRIIWFKKQVAHYQNELAKFAATVSLFERPSWIGSIKSKRSQKRSKLLKMGEFCRLSIERLICIAGIPKTTRDIFAIVGGHHWMGQSQ
jgi:hypothetical protein